MTEAENAEFYRHWAKSCRLRSESEMEIAKAERLAGMEQDARHSEESAHGYLATAAVYERLAAKREQAAKGVAA